MLPGNCDISVATGFADDNDQSRVAAMLAGWLAAPTLSRQWFSPR